MSATHPEVSREKLQRDFTAVVADTEVLLKSAATATGDRAVALKAGVEDSLALARESLDRLREASVAQATQAARVADRYVHESPWRAIGITAAVGTLTGLVAGLMFSRRGRSNGSRADAPGADQASVR
jgi:ElaB/YqjD/DUF883 family membrane-anchored ribosome-binding protein